MGAEASARRFADEAVGVIREAVTYTQVLQMVGLALALLALLGMAGWYVAGKDRGRVEACESVCGGEARWDTVTSSDAEEPGCVCVLLEKVEAP